MDELTEHMQKVWAETEKEAQGIAVGLLEDGDMINGMYRHLGVVELLGIAWGDVLVDPLLKEHVAESLRAIADQLFEKRVIETSH